MNAATSSGVPTGWFSHGCARPLRAKIASATRRASSRESRITTTPRPLVRSISGGIPADGLAVAEEDRLLVADPLDPAADVVRVGVSGDQLEGHLLAAAADQERQPVLDRRRVVADGAGVVVRAAGASAARRGASRAGSAAPRRASAAAPGSRSPNSRP